MGSIFPSRVYCGPTTAASGGIPTPETASPPTLPAAPPNGIPEQRHRTPEHRNFPEQRLGASPNAGTPPFAPECRSSRAGSRPLNRSRRPHWSPRTRQHARTRRSAPPWTSEDGYWPRSGVHRRQFVTTSPERPDDGVGFGSGAAVLPPFPPSSDAPGQPLSFLPGALRRAERNPCETAECSRARADPVEPERSERRSLVAGTGDSRTPVSSVRTGELASSDQFPLIWSALIALLGSGARPIPIPAEPQHFCTQIGPAAPEHP